MILKLAIIAGLAILGVMIFYTEISTFFPSITSTAPDSLKSDVDKLSDEATGFVADRLNETSVQLGQVANDTTNSIIDNIQDAQEHVVNNTAGLNPLDSVQEILSGDQNNNNNNTNTTTENP